MREYYSLNRDNESASWDEESSFRPKGIFLWSCSIKHVMLPAQEPQAAEQLVPLEQWLLPEYFVVGWQPFAMQCNAIYCNAMQFELDRKKS